MHCSIPPFFLSSKGAWGGKFFRGALSGFCARRFGEDGKWESRRNTDERDESSEIRKYIIFH